MQIPFDGPYGTKSEKMTCPLSALIEARFTDFSQEGKDYPNVSVLEKKFVSPSPRYCLYVDGVGWTASVAVIVVVVRCGYYVRLPSRRASAEV